MALKADGVDIAAVQQTRVLRSVRRVAGDAPFDLDWRMLEREWPHLFGVAFCTDGVTCGGRPKQLVQRGAVGIVAIRAFQQTLVHAVMHGPRELAANVGVAGVAQGGRCSLEQAGWRLCCMDGVATETAHLAYRVSGPKKIVVITVKLVAGEAALVRFFRWSDRELEEFRLVAPRLHVGFSRSVAIFARGGTGGIFFPLQFHFPVWVCMEPFGLWYMAKLAGLGADVVISPNPRHHRFLWRGKWARCSRNGRGGTRSNGRLCRGGGSLGIQCRTWHDRR